MVWASRGDLLSRSLQTGRETNRTLKAVQAGADNKRGRWPYPAEGCCQGKFQRCFNRMQKSLPGRVCIFCSLCLECFFSHSSPNYGSPPGYSVHGVFLAGVLEGFAIFLFQGNLPYPGIQLASPVSPVLQADSYRQKKAKSQTYLVVK